MGSRGPVDDESLRAVLTEAKGRLTDAEHERLLGCVPLVMGPRVGLSRDGP
ncbi:MAG TPA: hypothetical protein VIB49_04705 [Thermoplasmata archaeon]